MTESEYRQRITPSIIRDVFENHILTLDSPKYAITVSGHLLTISGRTLWDSPSQATKAFYNAFSWRAKRTLHESITGRDNYSWWRDSDGTAMWSAFKKELKDNYGFKIIKCEQRRPSSTLQG